MQPSVYELKFTLASLLFLPATMLAQKIKEPVQNNWSGSGAGYYYFLPNEEIHPTIIGTTDFKSIHFEARYNYEDVNTGSLFAGYTFKTDNKFSWSVTPMGGIAAGNTNGVLPGLECNASYSKLHFYSENEYMISFDGRENNFFYSWTQLSADIIKNLQAGVLTQSMKWQKTKFDVQRGIYGEVSVSNLKFDLYYFNPLTTYDFALLSVTIDF